MDITAYILFGRARYRVPSVLFEMARKQRDTGSLRLRELARRAEISPTATQYELRRLAQAGLVSSVGAGRTRSYTLNRESPIYAELRTILRKTDASAAATPIDDMGLWKRKRAQQKRDHNSNRLSDKSAFMANRSLAENSRMTYPDDVDYGD